MDIPYMVPFRGLSEAGEIDPDMAMEIASNVTTSFFDKHLKGENVDMSELDNQYEMLNLNISSGIQN